MRRAVKAWMAVGIAAAMTLAAGAGTASAASAGVQSRFAAQARAAGLSAAQADLLQQEATSYIRAHGGTQAALNVVDFPGGSITFVVPGEKYARDLATHPQVADAAGCGSTAFCAYENAFFEGSEISVFNNCENATMNWKTEGSYINDMPWVVAWFGQGVNDLVYATPKGPFTNQEVNWEPVVRIESCYWTVQLSLDHPTVYLQALSARELLLPWH